MKKILISFVLASAFVPGFICVGFSEGLSEAATSDAGYMVTPELRIRAVIHTEEKGPVEAVWQMGGEDTTAGGHEVIWGHFYASPSDVTWGSAENPDLFVKIWFDAGGRIDVSYFHVSVPDIDVYSEYDGAPLQGTTTLDRRYVRLYYNQDGQHGIEENYEDGIAAAGYSPAGSPSGYSAISDLRIGAVINTVDGPIDAVWRKGGDAMTAGGHQVFWGHFHASPSDVDWGSSDNPDLFVKVWFDASGRIDVNFFHVSVPDIEVYSDYPSDGAYNKKGTTIMADRYIRHEYQKFTTTQPRFAVFSDPHYYDTELGVSGSAFEAYLAGDRKLLRESEAILTAFTDAITGESGIDFVIVSGDLTKDGTRASHQEFADNLKMLEDNGLPVYVVPGNHDLNNPNAFSYSGDTETPEDNVSPEEFAEIYADYGYAEATDRDPDSLSYVAEPAPGLWLFGLDSCRLGYGNGMFSQETIDWIIGRLDQAKARDKKVIGMMHHAILEHFPEQADLMPGTLIENWETVSETLAEAGMNLIFTGHLHAQDIVTNTWDAEGGRTISLTDVETGSLVTYPNPYRIVTLDEENVADIQSRFITEIDYDTGGVAFPAYSEDYLTEKLYEWFYPDWQAGASQAAEAFKAYYMGDESPDQEALAAISFLTQSDDPNLQYAGQYIYGWWTDLPPADNDVTVQW
ncbi:metallophosphoesterase [Desulfobacterales bacterium HSG2]|nr:metallophosphoesterase [Desulfobacterales bacterium HSG2]